MGTDVLAHTDTWTSDGATDMSMKGDSPECECTLGLRERKARSNP